MAMFDLADLQVTKLSFSLSTMGIIFLTMALRKPVSTFLWTKACISMLTYFRTSTGRCSYVFPSLASSVSAPSPSSSSLRWSTTFLIGIIIIITRPKPAYGRQGLDWIVGPGCSFVVFSTKKKHVNQPKTMINHETTLKKPWKPTKNHDKPWNHLEKPWKTNQKP